MTKLSTRIPRPRTWRSRLAVLVALMVVGPASLAAWPAQGQDDLGSLREQRRRVQSERAQAASQVDAQQAEVGELTAALEALQTQVSGAEARVADAERRLAEAEARVVASEQAVQEQLVLIAGLEAQLASRAVESFVGQTMSGQTSMFDSDDVYRSMRMRSLVESVTESEADVVEQLEAAREDLELEEAAARTARQEADEYRGQVEGELVGLEQARTQQAELTQAADARLDRMLGEAASLAALDDQLGQRIAREEAEAARRLAEAQVAAAARAKAAAEAAAAARASSGGGSGSASSGGGSSASSGGGGGSSTSASSGGGGGASRSVASAGTIVNVRGIWVHQSIASQLDSLLAAAAADGISLAGGGYRDPSSQIRLRQAHCGTSNYAVYEMSPSQCRPPTARPGASLHERGLAIDFTHNGRIISSRSSTAFQWLARNAASYGLYNLPSEPWHWSTTGG
jgi:peptidoglycan hydrolase CwlO-like protein